VRDRAEAVERARWLAIMEPMPSGAPQSSRSTLADLKERNEWRVVDALRGVDEASRAELVRLTGLSRSTVANVVGELQARGMIDERLPHTSEPRRMGRPGTSIRLRARAGVAVGVAIDREHLRVVVVDLRATVLAERVVDFHPGADGLAVLDEAAGMIRALMAGIGEDVGRIAGVGVGLPGPVDLAQGGVDRASAARRWPGLDARAELSRRLGGAPVFPDNDSTFGALGESEYGAARGVEDVVYVKVGPGIGGGLVLGGRLFRGSVGYAGEVGHFKVVEPGLPCACGRRGCVSTVASSRAIVDRLVPAYGPGLKIEDVLAAAASGDPVATTALRDAGRWLGRALAGVVSALNPELLVLGGDIGAHSPDFLESAAAELLGDVTETTAGAVRVVSSALEDRAEALGASARVLRDDDLVRAFVAAA
jgi:predicted NBD/HSP70 family sugar kinase